MDVRAEVVAIPSSSPIKVNLRQVVYALSDALDLVGIDDVAHGKRVAVMAAACGRYLGLSQAEIVFLFDFGMLHDVGVSSTSTHRHLVVEFDWESSQNHCLTGYQLLRDFPPLASLALPIRYHHTHWEDLLKMSEVPPAIAEQANLIYLVDRVDALTAPFYAGGEVLMHTSAIRNKIASTSGVYFSPKLVDAFLAASASEAFWLELEPRGIQATMQKMLGHGSANLASMDELKQLARVFSRIVDAKSPFTAQHSLGVACLARFLAERLGVGPENCDKLEIAGLLHDLGKLRVPDEVLDKPAALDERERKIMNAHSFETFQILRYIEGFEEITQWAAYHHEEPDGNGYPFHLRAGDLPIEARILRVADIFQAMVQDRPYRPGLSADAVLDFMNKLVAQGRIDPVIIAAAAGDMPGAMSAARPGLNVR